LPLFKQTFSEFDLDLHQKFLDVADAAKILAMDPGFLLESLEVMWL
jgi:hypothetical protein